MNKSDRAIIFDFGGVLVDWDPRYLYRQLFNNEAAMESFFTEVGLSAWNEQQDAGRPFVEAIPLLIAGHPERAELIHAFWERWDEMIGGALEPTVEVMRELKSAGYPLYGLSNWSAETFPRARPMFEFFDWFEVIMLSGEVKMSKPDPRIFELMLEKIGSPAQQCVFIDDSAANVVVADKLGFQAIHFQSAELLREELIKIGVLKAE